MRASTIAAPAGRSPARLGLMRERPVGGPRRLGGGVLARPPRRLAGEGPVSPGPGAPLHTVRGVSPAATHTTPRQRSLVDGGPEPEECRWVAQGVEAVAADRRDEEVDGIRAQVDGRADARGGRHASGAVPWLESVPAVGRRRVAGALVAAL